MTEEMLAFVLAGGKGLRISPFARGRPKHLIPIGGETAIEHILRCLRANGIDRVVLCVSETTVRRFKRELGCGRRLGLRINYSVANGLETSGRILKEASRITSTFLVYYGDIISDIDLREMVHFHRSRGGIATLAVSQRARLPFGVVTADRSDRIVRFEEKPRMKDVLVNAGVFVFEPAFLAYCSETRDISSHVIPAMISAKERLNAFVVANEFWDIGILANIESLKEHLRPGSSRPLTSSRGPKTQVAPIPLHSP